MEKNRKPILQPNKNIVVPNGQAAKAVNAGAKPVNVNMDIRSPEEGIAAVLRTFVAMTGTSMPALPELARALGAAFRKGTHHAVMSHHVGLLNNVVKTKIPDWVDPKSKETDQKQLVKAVSQMKEAIIRNINRAVEPPKKEKQKPGDKSKEAPKGEPVKKIIIDE